MSFPLNFEHFHLFHLPIYFPHFFSFFLLPLFLFLSGGAVGALTAWLVLRARLRTLLDAGQAASGAPLTLIDEPVAGLDKPSIQYLARALTSVAAQPGRLVVVAHYETLAGVPWGTVVDLART